MQNVWRSVGIIGIAFIASCAGAQDRPVAEQIAEGPAHPPAGIRMVAKNEPGTPLILSGTIYRSDGKTPAPGVRLFVYHTDNTGKYGAASEPGPYRPRLRGWIETGDDGRYEITTIRPGPYPDADEPAHIHAAVSAPGYVAHWIGEWWFADDPRITPEIRDRYNASARRFGLDGPSIMEVEVGADGVQSIHRDLRLRPSSP